MADATSPLLGGDSRQGTPTSGEVPLYHDKTQSPRAKYMQFGFIFVGALMVLTAIILSIYRGATTGSNGFLYFLLGISLLGFVVIQIILVYFIKSGDLAKEKAWFLYAVGFCTILETIFIDILLFR